MNSNPSWKLAPVEPTPQILAAASLAAWPVASAADMELARKAARIVLMSMDAAPGSTLESVAAAIATMAPAYRAMLAAAPSAPGDAQKVYHFEQRSRFGPWIEVEKPTAKSVEFVKRSDAPAAGDARKPDFARAEQIAADFVQDYEWRGEDVADRDTSYTPNKRERAMITDAILGLLAEPEFVAALAAQVPQQGEA